MAYIRCGGGGIPAALKTDMNAVFNKKFETSADYPPNTWADTVNLMGALPERTASGTIATFNDGADLVPLKSLTLTVTPSQSGTGDPSPSNPRPLNSFSSLTVEHTGANVWGGSSTISKDNTQPYIVVPCVLKAGTYTISGNITSDTDGVRLYFRNGSTAIIPLNIATATGYGTVTLTSDVTEFRFFGQQSNTGSNAASIANFQIEVGSTPSTYTAYVTDPHTLELGSTVYGLTGDCATGEFEETHGVVLDLSSLSWTYQSANSRFVSNSIASVVKAPPNNSTVVENALCEIYKVDISNNTASSAYDNIIAVSSNGNIQIRDTSLNGDLDALANRLNGVKFAYPLATPTELTTDPVEVESFKGGNNIWCEGNSTVAVEYRADIDLLINELGG